MTLGKQGGQSVPPSFWLASATGRGCPDPRCNDLLRLFQGKYEERFLKDETISQQINSVESLPELHLSPEDEKHKQLFQGKLHVRSRPPSKPTIVRGVTYYKAQSTESENDIEEQGELGWQPWLARQLATPVAEPVPALKSCLEVHGQSAWGYCGGEGLEAGGGGTAGTSLLEAAKQHAVLEPCAEKQCSVVLPWKAPGSWGNRALHQLLTPSTNISLKSIW